MERWLVGLAGMLVVFVVGVGIYYGFSYLILTLGGRLFSLTGRGRRRD